MLTPRRVKKRLAMHLASVFLFLWGFVARKKLGPIKKVGILFLPILGIGDLVMLSPIIQKIAKIFTGSEVYLITWVPELIAWENIKVLSASAAKSEKFDLLISPTLNLRHLPYIFRARYWCGYFAKNVVQSNFGVGGFKYNFAFGHYLERGIGLIKALNKNIGNNLEQEYKQHGFVYPNIITSTPKNSVLVINEPYLVVSIFSKFPDRQWPTDSFVLLIKDILATQKIKKIVLIGDSSSHNQESAKNLILKLNLPANIVINTTGQTSLTETAYLIANSHMFLGLDSGPSHLAYLLAPRSLVIFVTVIPAERLPVIKTNRQIIALYPDPAPNRALYDGLGSANATESAYYAGQISLSRAKSAAYKLLNS